MEDYVKLNKYRKQLDYIGNLLEIMYDENDAGLYKDFTEIEESKFCDFIDFMYDIKNNVEKKLKLVEVK